MTVRSLILFVLVLILSIPALPASAALELPEIQSAECPFGFPADLKVTCGKLTVPENRTVDSGRQVTLPFAVIHSSNPSPKPDPVIYTSSGGPGLGAFGGWKHLSYNFNFLSTRDIILLEQRGTRWSAPYLNCPELNEAMFASLLETLPRDQEIASEAQAALACRDSFFSQRIDLNAYNTIESVADLNDLRTLLGIEQWNFIGGSYAARIGLTYARLYPNSLRSLVLDSVYDPAMPFLEARVPAFAAALERLFAGCAADPGCAVAYPHLEAHFYAMLERANANPIPVSITHPRSGAPVTVHLTGDDLALGMFNALRDPALIPYLPFVIEQVYSENTSVLAPLAQNGFTAMFSTPLGIYYAVECAEEFPFNDLERQRAIAAQFPGLQNFLPTPADPAICDAWQAQPVDASFREAFISDIPTLVLSGEYDAVIAPAVSAAVAGRFSQAVYVEIPGFSHAVLDVEACARQMAADFIEEPVSFAPTCTPGRQVTFHTTANIFPTPVVYQLNRSGGLLYGVSGGLLLIVIAGIYFTIKHRSRLLGAAGLLMLIFVGGSALLLFTTDPVLLALGIPAPALWLTGLPLAAFASLIAVLRKRSQVTAP